MANINESLKLIQDFQTKVCNLKSSIHIQSSIIDNTNDIKIVKECFEELLKQCDELDKFTQK